jgi:ABC-2 type transport system ATP-binding protein
VIIETEDLGKRYKQTWALSECTFSLPTGGVTALVGPNGAGKTTLQHLLVGLTAPTTGEVSVLDGLAPGSPEALSRIGFVAQDMALYRHLTVAVSITSWPAIGCPTSVCRRTGRWASCRAANRRNWR